MCNRHAGMRWTKGGPQTRMRETNRWPGACALEEDIRVAGGVNGLARRGQSESPGSTFASVRRLNYPAYCHIIQIMNPIPLRSVAAVIIALSCFVTGAAENRH